MIRNEVEKAGGRFFLKLRHEENGVAGGGIDQTFLN